MVPFVLLMPLGIDVPRGKGQPCLQVPIQSPSLTAITSLQVDLEAAGYGSPRSRRNGYNPDADRVSPESFAQGLSVAVGK